MARPLLGGLLLGAAGLAPWAAAAQDVPVPAEEGGLRMIFGIEQRLETGRNLALETPDEGSSSIATTRFSFGLENRTPLDTLTFGASTALVIENSPDTDGTEVEFGRPDLTFGYTRAVPDALFGVTAFYREDDVDAFDDPADLTEDADDGTETTYGLGLRYEVGRTAPLGFAFEAAYEAVEYQDTTDPDLDDTETWRIGGEARLRFSEVLSGTAGLSFEREEEEDPGTTVTETATATLGLAYAVSPRLDLTASLGVAEIETESFGVTDRTTGPVAALGLVYDMPNGAATADLTVTTDEDEGTRAELVFGRSLELPAGALAARLGVSGAEGEGLELIGGLVWSRIWPASRIDVALEREVGFDDDTDETTVVTLLDIGWSQEVNPLSSIGLDLSYAVSDAPSERIEEAGLTASYSYRLTPDWTLTSGASYRVRDDAGGWADSPSVFVTLGRSFEYRY